MSQETAGSDSLEMKASTLAPWSLVDLGILDAPSRFMGCKWAIPSWSPGKSNGHLTLDLYAAAVHVFSISVLFLSDKKKKNIGKQ